MLAAVGHFLELRTGNLRRTSHPVDQATPLFDGNDEYARIAILRRIGVVEIGLFTFARGARRLLTRVTVVGNKISSDVTGALVHGYVNILSFATVETMIKGDCDTEGAVGRCHAISDFAGRLQRRFAGLAGEIKQITERDAGHVVGFIVSPR